MKPIDPDNLPSTWEEVHALPSGDPVIGMRLYVAGKDEWWFSTRVVSIEEDDNDNDE